MESNLLISGAERARNWLKNNNYPYSDNIELHPSNQELPEGGHYGIEIPVVTSLKVLRYIIQNLKKAGIKKAILGETVGSFFLSDSEIKRNARIKRRGRVWNGLFYRSASRIR